MAFEMAEKDGEALSNMNVVPLIDVMLVLLILFIVTIPVNTHAVKLDMPDHAGAMLNLTPINLEIDFDGTVLWDGHAVPNRETLQAYLNGIGQQANQPPFLISANRLARYETVALVLSDAQRLGVQRIAMVGTNAFAN
jgi:biopolymer transport protein ExbD